MSEMEENTPVPKKAIGLGRGGYARIASVKNKTTKSEHYSMADSTIAFADANPKCRHPDYLPLFIAALTAAYLIDQSPSAAFLTNYNSIMGRLRKELGFWGPKEEDTGSLFGEQDDL